MSCGSRDSHIGEDWAAAWSSHDVENFTPLFTDDAVYEDVTFGEVNHGSAELRKFAASFFDAVYKTGKKFSIRGASIIDVRGGEISRNLDFYDAAGIMRQVGLLPQEGAK